MGKQKKGALAIVSALWWLAKVLTALINAVRDLAKAQGLSDDDVDASVHRLGTPEGVATIKQMAVIILKGSVSSVAAAPATVAKILALCSTVRVPLAGRFVVADGFVINTKASAAVRISYLSDNFKSWFLTQVEQTVGVSNLVSSELLKSSLDAPILAALREQFDEDKVKTTLTAIWYLMSQQKNGESGVLLTNGAANIFYVLDVNGVLRAVYVYWNGDGWDVRADSIENPCEWHAGYRVFSRNS